MMRASNLSSSLPLASSCSPFSKPLMLVLRRLQALGKTKGELVCLRYSFLGLAAVASETPGTREKLRELCPAGDALLLKPHRHCDCEPLKHDARCLVHHLISSRGDHPTKADQDSLIGRNRPLQHGDVLRCHISPLGIAFASGAKPRLPAFQWR